MELSIEVIASLPNALVRTGLAAWVAEHLEATPEERVALCTRLQVVIDTATDADIDKLRDTFTRAGDDWRLHLADPLARRLTRTYMAEAVFPWAIEGRENLASFLSSPARRRMVVCNHLSYTDTQVTDVVLSLAGLEDFAGRLVAIAGPKVYTDPWRRMASIALNTRKTAQSSTVASEQDTLTARELAVVALDTLAECGRLMDEGYIILLYPEGTRARERRLQPFLRAAARYLLIEGVEVLPLGQVGGELIFPVDSTIMVRQPATLVFGEAFTPREHGGKTAALAECHRRLAMLLPETHQPLEGAARVT